MKKIIQLVFAVLLGLSIFSVAASAEENMDVADAPEAAENAVAATDAAFRAEDTLAEAIISEDPAADYGEQTKDGDAEGTDSEMPAQDDEINAAETEDALPPAEENGRTGTLDGTLGETPDAGVDEASGKTPDASVDGSLDETPDAGVDGNLDETKREIPDGISGEPMEKTRVSTPDGTLPADGAGAPSEAGDETEELPSDPGTACEEPAVPADFVLSGQDIPIENGTYSYELVIKPTGKLTFNNKLENSYQGVDGKYTLQYEIAEPDNHVMVVTGKFQNIITASPLVKEYRDLFREDSYSYQLDLRTAEGFSFTNTLRYQFMEEERGYSIYYDYDLLTNKQTFSISEPRDDKEETERRQQKKQQRTRKSLFSAWIPLFRK